MTRKRKNVVAETQNEDASNDQSFDNDEKSQSAGFANKKGKGRQFGGDNKEFKPKRGKFDGNSEEQAGGDFNDKGRFPTELIHYLRQMARETPDPDMIEVFMEKCLEEVKGKEETLLNYTEGCFVVEQIFLRSKQGAFEFLERLNHRKKSSRLQLLSNAASERTLEKLLYALAPLENEKHVELISSWIEIITDEWQTVLFDRSGSFFIRTLGRVLVGLKEEHLKYKSTFEAIQQAGIGHKKVLASAKQELNKLLSRVFDFVSMKDFLNLSSASMVVQNFIGLDKFIKAKIAIEFLKKFIEKENVANSWRQANASIVWESLIELISDDEELQLELFNAIKEQLLQLAAHDIGRYPLEAFFKQVKSAEVAKEIADQLLPKFEEFTQRNNFASFIGQFLQMVSNFEDLQSSVVKVVRCMFNARKEDGLNLLPNLLTLNDANIEMNGEEIQFTVENSKLFGSIITQKLFQFHKNNTLLSSFDSLSTQTLNQMAVHTIASHVFDGFSLSPTIELENKKQLFKKLDLSELIKNSYGSRVFESLWFELDWTDAEREQIVNDLFLPLMASTERNKFIGILINKLHVNEFRENRKQWRSQLQKWINEERLKRRQRQQYESKNRGGNQQQQNRKQSEQGENGNNAKSGGKHRKKPKKKRN